MSARLDHAVVIVPSLRQAVRGFEGLGFHVVMGGRTGPVHNALILFGDGTYIELTTNRFSALRPLLRGLNAAGLIGYAAAKRDDMLHRFLPWLGAPRGTIDWCIRVNDIRATIRQLRDAGVEMVAEMPFERQRPDGEVAKWLLAGPRDVSLPFFIEDLTPLEIRVPFRGHSTHPNGVTGVGRLVLPEDTKAGLDRTLGLVLAGGTESGSPGRSGLANVAIGGSGKAAESNGAFALELQRPSGNHESLDPSATSGARIKLVGT